MADEGMQKAIDVLCKGVLKAGPRMKHTVRNAELHRVVTAMRAAGWRDIYKLVADAKNISVTNLKQIMRNMK